MHRLLLLLLPLGWLLPVAVRGQETTSVTGGTTAPDTTASPPVSSRRWQGEWSGQVALEAGWFYDEGYYPNQRNYAASVVMRPTYTLTASQLGLKLTVRPFLRLDAADRSRSHADLRELYASWSHRAWEVNAGVQAITWGNMLGPSLVNMLNQTDEREDFTRFERLGQPVLDIARVGATHSLRLYVAPVFRPKQFPDERSRLYYFPLPIATAQQTIAHRGWPALAARYTQRLGSLDVALSHFYGTNPAPVMYFNPQRFDLEPHYRTIHQTGLETQWITGNLTAKAEGTRRQDGRTYWSYNTGLEYLFANLGGRNVDVLLAAEYLRDAWKLENHYPFADMLFATAQGTLGGLHTSQLSVRLLTNRKSWTPFLNVEATRHFGDHWQGDVEWTSFVGTRLPISDALAVIQYNNSVRVAVRRYW